MQISLVKASIGKYIMARRWNSTSDSLDNLHLSYSNSRDKCETLLLTLQGIKPDMLEPENCEGLKSQTNYSLAADDEWGLHNTTW